MVSPLLYPRLPLLAAREHLEFIKGHPPAELTKLVVLDSDQVIYSATGGTRVTPDVLEGVRNRLVLSATGLGFPNRSGSGVMRFDAEAAQILQEHLPISPGEASRDEVWSFISICILPDLATWRFPDQNDRRFLGGVRNAFQRLWWRAWLLRDDQAQDPWCLLRLPEDALVGLMERPAISSNSDVARPIARAIVQLANGLPASLREDAWRRAYKLIRQRVPLVNLDALPEAELLDQLANLCRVAEEHARKNQDAHPA